MKPGRQTTAQDFYLRALLLLTFLFASPSAFAACSSPAGNAGDIAFSSGSGIMAYCNGTSWISMGAPASAISFGTLTTGDFCVATSGTTIACTTATVNMATQTTGVLGVANGGTGLNTIATNGIPYGQGSSNLAVASAGSQYNVFVAGASGVPGFGQIALNQSAAVTGALGVSNGGTGQTSLTQYGVLLGNGTGAVGAVTGATNTVLAGQGSANPAFTNSPTLTSLSLTGVEVLQFATDYSTTGAQQDVAINTSSSVRYTGAGSATFYGIVAGSAGQVLILHNASSSSLTLSNQSSSETTVGNRIITGAGVDITLPSNASATLQYDGTASRWRVTANSGAGLPAGATTQVQFNNAGNFGADSNLTWDNTNKLLAVGTSAATPVATTGTLAGATVNVVPQAFSFSGTGTGAGGTAIGGGTTGQVTYYSGANALSPTANITVSGTSTTIGGPLAIAVNASDFTTTGAHADIAANTYSAVRYNGAATATWYGIVAGSAGQLLTIHNPSAYTLTLSNNSGSESTAANKILTGSGADLILGVNNSAILQYDGTASRWRVIGGSSTAAGASGQVQYNNAGAMGASSNLVWDNTNARLGLGTATPSALLHVNGSSILGGVNGSLYSNDQGGAIELGCNAGACQNSVTNGTPYIDFHYGNGTSQDYNIRLQNSADGQFTIAGGTTILAGTTSKTAALITNAAEPVTVSATAATGTIAYYLASQSVLYYTSNATANWTVNFAWSSGTTMNAALATGQAVTAVFLVTQGSTAYYNSAVQVDGTATGVTTYWLGGSAPTSGNASGIDVYSYTIIKTGSATYTVLATQAQY